MRRWALFVVVAVASMAADTAAAQERILRWNKLDVAAKLDNDGRLHVTEVFDVVMSGEVLTLDRDWNISTDQRVRVTSVHRLDPDGTRVDLKNVKDRSTDSYQAYDWGVRMEVLTAKDPPFPTEINRRYVIEYELTNAITPSFDLPAGPFPQNRETSPRNPIDRAREVLEGWRAAWPDLNRHYRVNHDVAFPTTDTGTSLSELNYRFEYDSSWILLDKDLPIGVATPDVNFRVHRLLRYLPDGRPSAVNLENAAFRIFALAGPLVGGLALLALFLVVDRMFRRWPTIDREIFEKQIGSAPPELVAARVAGGGAAPTLEQILTRLAAKKEVAIVVISPEIDDRPAVIQIRLMTARNKLHPLDLEVVGKILGTQDFISTADLRLRYKGEGFEPDALIREALRNQGFKGTRYSTTRRGWRVVRFALLLAGFGCAVASLINGSIVDPGVLAAMLVPGTILGGLWAMGSPTQRPSVVSLSIAVTVLGLLGAALALSPNTPLPGFAALGLGLAGLSHCALLLSRVPQQTAGDLEFDAARRWGFDELKRPYPALSDAWIGSIEASGGKRALARWRSKYSSQLSGPDLGDSGAPDTPTGPPFTGEAARVPELPHGWADGFSVDTGEEGDD